VKPYYQEAGITIYHGERGAVLGMADYFAEEYILTLDLAKKKFAGGP
jgi:hypothetical protein